MTTSTVWPSACTLRGMSNASRGGVSFLVGLLAATLTACAPASSDQAFDPPPDDPPLEDDPRDDEVNEPQGSSLAWATILEGPTDEDEVDGIAADPSGNLYLSGKFEGSLTVAGFAPLESRGAADIMVARVDPAGVTVWVEQFGDVGEDNIFDVATDAEGNVLLSGMFTGTVRFGDITLSSATPNASDAVVVKMSPEGEVIWATRAGGASDDGANEISVSASGVIAVNMQTRSEVVEVGTTTLSVATPGPSSSVVAVLNPADGSFAWARLLDAPVARAKCLAIDARGGVLTGGDFIASLVVHDSLGTSTVSARGESDAYLTRWTPEGQLEWVRQFGDAGQTLCKGVAINDGGDIFLTATYSAPLRLGDDLVGVSANADQLVIGLEGQGGVRWWRRLSSPARLSGSELELDLRGGPMFPVFSDQPVVVESSPTEAEVTLSASDAQPAILRFLPDGRLGEVVATPRDLTPGRASEIARAGTRLYVDSPFDQSATGKDARILAYDLVDAEPAGTTEFSVTVADGWGGGFYRPGDTVYVSSAHAPFETSFVAWAGPDVELLPRADEWHTQFIMPPHDVALEVVTAPRADDDASAFDLLGATGVTKRVRTSFPEAMEGLVLLLHGTNSNSRIIEGLETRGIINAAARQRIGVVAIDSEETASGIDLDGDGKLRFNSSLDAPGADFDNIDALLERLTDEGHISVATKLYALGMSSGGGMAVALGAIPASGLAGAYPRLHFEAVVSMCSAAQGEALGITNTPTAWWMCGRQEGAGVKLTQSLASSSQLAERGIRTRVSVNEPHPMTPRWLSRAPEFDVATAEALFGALRDAGVVGNDGVVDLTRIDGSALSLTGFTGDERRRIENQLQVLGADHEVYSGQALALMAFLVAP